MIFVINHMSDISVLIEFYLLTLGDALLRQDELYYCDKNIYLFVHSQADEEVAVIPKQEYIFDARYY